MPKEPRHILITWGDFAKFLIAAWLIGVCSGITMLGIGVWTTWWQQLGANTLNFHLAYPLLFIVYFGFAGIVGTIKYYEYKKNVRVKRLEQQKKVWIGTLNEKFEEEGRKNENKQPT